MRCCESIHVLCENSTAWRLWLANGLVAFKIPPIRTFECRISEISIYRTLPCQQRRTNSLEVLCECRQRLPKLCGSKCFAPVIRAISTFLYSRFREMIDQYRDNKLSKFLQASNWGAESLLWSISGGQDIIHCIETKLDDIPPSPNFPNTEATKWNRLGWDTDQRYLLKQLVTALLFDHRRNLQASDFSIWGRAPIPLLACCCDQAG